MWLDNKLGPNLLQVRSDTLKVGQPKRSASTSSDLARKQIEIQLRRMAHSDIFCPKRKEFQDLKISEPLKQICANAL